MDAMEALRTAATETETPLTHIGLAMGKSRQFVHATMRKQSTPQCNTMARMLEVCGYGLYAIPLDEAPRDALRITASDDDKPTE